MEPTVSRVDELKRGDQVEVASGWAVVHDQPQPNKHGAVGGVMRYGFLVKFADGRIHHVSSLGNVEVACIPAEVVPHV